ncbi:hypothetical protein QWY93_18390 [Echinicola jeungdonensis]|uniref:hypothetical protein n=1 Tax=Echinicola jeungdonensis TaxID=709343 RepID=UPI0025B2DBBF|nr:hypothetical protein [Echinicola jeungdonensis]MDN3671272.1 hypothetical protein [Echinicola jeungdonensis]
MRFLVSPNPSATIFLLGFAEAGNNWGKYAEFNPYDLKKSAGFGARIFMPAFGYWVSIGDMGLIQHQVVTSQVEECSTLPSDNSLDKHGKVFKIITFAAVAISGVMAQEDRVCRLGICAK